MIPEPPTGRRAVIIGNGESVDHLPPAAWRLFESDPDCLLVGTNRALVFASLADVKLDAMVLRDRCRNLWYPQEWGTRYDFEVWRPWPGWKVGRDRTARVDEFVKLTKDETWQVDDARDLDGDRAVMKQDTVILMAANWAWLQGARDFALIGVDYTGTCAKMLPPYDKAPMSWQGQYDKPVPKWIKRQFTLALLGISEAGGSMVNLSPLTQLEAVPYQDWNEWCCQA